MRRTRESEALNAPFFRSEPPTRPCMADGCLCAGDYRAPVSRNRLGEYYWFCLEHVRAYNARWDYFRGMSQREIEQEIRADTTWHRPSWPLGLGCDIHDPLGLLGGAERQRQREAAERPRTREGQALATLDLPAAASFAEIKARYKTLVKRLHPDANGGDREAEEKLKIVNQAYSTLKAAYAQPA